jgi:hypothetical protein
VKMVTDSMSVANTDVQTGQALQLTIVLTYLNNNARGNMIKTLDARMDGGDVITHDAQGCDHWDCVQHYTPYISNIYLTEKAKLRSWLRART